MRAIVTEPNWGSQRASVFWGTAQAAAREGYTTAQYWQALNEHAQSLGLDRPEISAIDASRLRGQAGRGLRAAQALQGSELNTAITGDMISVAPYSRDLASRNSYGQWQVRFAHTVIGEEGEDTQYRSVVFSGQLPYTVGELMDAVEGDAIEMANDYGVEHVSISDLSLIAV